MEIIGSLNIFLSGKRKLCVSFAELYIWPFFQRSSKKKKSFYSNSKKVEIKTMYNVAMNTIETIKIN